MFGKVNINGCQVKYSTLEKAHTTLKAQCNGNITGICNIMLGYSSICCRMLDYGLEQAHTPS